MAEYADLFDGVGLMDGDVHLEVDSTVTPVQMPLRRLPIGVRDKVAAELQRLEEAGIIAPVSEPRLHGSRRYSSSLSPTAGFVCV